MSRFLDTTGRSTLGIGLCARCSRKFSLDDLQPDPNYPAMMVCRDDVDEYDPYRMAARPPESVTLPFYRPDDALSTDVASALPLLELTADGVHLFRID